MKQWDLRDELDFVQSSSDDLGPQLSKLHIVFIEIIIWNLLISQNYCTKHTEMRNTIVHRIKGKIIEGSPPLTTRHRPTHMFLTVGRANFCH